MDIWGADLKNIQKEAAKKKERKKLRISLPIFCSHVIKIKFRYCKKHYISSIPVSCQTLYYVPKFNYKINVSVFL